MDRLHAAAVTVERAGGLLVDTAVPGVDDGVRVEGPGVGCEQCLMCFWFCFGVFVCLLLFVLLLFLLQLFALLPLLLLLLPLLMYYRCF